MKNDFIKYLLTFTLFLFAAITISCSGRSGNVSVSANTKNEESNPALPDHLIRMVSPGENSEFKLGEGVKVILVPEKMDNQPDSVILTFDGKYAGTLRSAPWEFQVPSTSITGTGRKSLKASGYRDGKTGNVVTRFIIIYTDSPPKHYGYKIVHTYPHDKEAYTQGLIYYNGLLYEGTGQQTGSTLREVELTSGKILRVLNLSPDLFGEGITLYKDRIYQVTWQSKVGFVYERSNFKQIKKIYYESEGWGLTTMNNQIVMSDGTNALYFIEPESFAIVSRLEVYDNEKKVDQLNELEFINGEIWANIWMTNLIARIDPASGGVKGYIDLKGILKDKDTDTDVDVLNGIAFDNEGGRIFVTGKNWPKLFEITITE